MSSGNRAGTKDVTYDLVSVMYHALQGAETYSVYARDAESNGDQDAAKFFKEVQDQNQKAADQAKQLLGKRLS